MKRLLLFATLAIAAVPALAQEELKDVNKTYTLAVGGVSCGNVVNDHDHLSNAAFYQELAWVEGFVIAKELSNPFTERDYDLNSLSLWIQNHCHAHPLDMLVVAADKFYREIGGRYFAPGTDPDNWKHYPEYKPEGVK